MEIPKHLQLLDYLSGDPTCAGARLTLNELSERRSFMLLAEAFAGRSSRCKVCLRSTLPPKHATPARSSTLPNLPNDVPVVGHCPPLPATIATYYFVNLLHHSA
jgi:hypothetical protein